MCRAGASTPAGFQCSAGTTGRKATAARSTTPCRATWLLGRRRRVTRCAYKYPSTSMIWKNNMHVVQTSIPPPNHGRMYRAISGSTAKSRKAPSAIAVP